MSDLPWAADRPLDIATVRRLLADQCHDVSAESIAPIGTGWDFDTYEVDQSWIFRFPRRKEYDGRFLSELALLDVIAPDMPVPVPHYTFRGRPSDLFPYHFGGYPKLVGTQASDVQLTGSACDTAAGQLADALSYLHTVDVQPLRALNLYTPADYESFTEQRVNALEVLPELRVALPPPLYRRCYGWLSDASAVPSEYNGPPRLIHGDLLPQHILLEPESGKVTGVLDWTDAAIAEPAHDVVGLWFWQGGDFVVRVLRQYRLPVDGSTRQRIAWRGRVVLLTELLWACRQKQADYVKFCVGRLEEELMGSAT